jgi:hypothetical protein
VGFVVPLNYNQLYYFYKIAELGSIAEASKSVLISSPALSMQLKELEEGLGTALFDRVGQVLERDKRCYCSGDFETLLFPTWRDIATLER